MKSSRQCIARVMFETWLFWAWLKQPGEGVSITIRPNAFKMADGWGKEASAQKNQNWSYHVAKCPVEIWADEEIQRQLSAMCRIFGRTLQQNVIKTVTSAITLLSLSKTRPQNSRISVNPSDAGSIRTKGLQRVYKRRGKLGRDAKPTGVWGSCASHARI